MLKIKRILKCKKLFIETDAGFVGDISILVFYADADKFTAAPVFD
jgi:hypothetical protein